MFRRESRLGWLSAQHVDAVCKHDSRETFIK